MWDFDRTIIVRRGFPNDLRTGVVSGGLRADFRTAIVTADFFRCTGLWPNWRRKATPARAGADFQVPVIWRMASWKDSQTKKV